MTGEEHHCNGFHDGKLFGENQKKNPHYLPLLALPLPPEIPGSETPLASEVLPVCSRSPEGRVIVVKLGDEMGEFEMNVSTHQPLLFQQVTGFFSLFAVLVFKLLKPGWGVGWVQFQFQVNVT